MPSARSRCSAPLTVWLRRKVVADEEGCMMYQLIKGKEGYYVLELYKDQ